MEQQKCQCSCWLSLFTIQRFLNIFFFQERIEQVWCKIRNSWNRWKMKHFFCVFLTYKKIINFKRHIFCKNVAVSNISKKLLVCVKTIKIPEFCNNYMNKHSKGDIFSLSISTFYIKTQQVHYLHIDRHNYAAFNCICIAEWKIYKNISGACYKCLQSLHQRSSSVSLKKQNRLFLTSEAEIKIDRQKCVFHNLFIKYTNRKTTQNSGNNSY